MSRNPALVVTPFPEPTEALGTRADVFLRYLDFFRDRLVDKIDMLAEPDLRRSHLPSGWAPIELLAHLQQVERRWLEWGFLGLEVGDPWADERDGRWFVPADVTLADVITRLADQAARTRAIVASHELSEAGRPSPRWDGAPPATLERVLFHLLQEYARHLGQLDIVVELAHGATGE